MFIILALALLVFLLFNTYTQGITVDGYTAKYFTMSQGASEDMFMLMKENGVGESSLKEFIVMEDRLLELEKISICSGIPRLDEAIAVSNTIKERFVGFDFSYHTIHLKQVAEPHKLINRHVSCD